MSGAAEATGAKASLDPQSLVLRPRPRPIIRLRKGLTVGIAGAISAAVIALAWASLSAPRSHAAAVESDLAPVAGTPEVLAGAPSDYAQVPRLGPPLPGDLGRAILDRQRHGLPTGDRLEASATERPPGLPEHSRETRAEGSAPFSALFVRSSGSAPPDDAARPAGAQQPKVDASGSSDEKIPELVPPRSPWTLAAGTIIPASLITGISSEIPGTVIAQVTEPVRDSATGRTILVPQGARLIGSYDSAIAYGQKRALLAWHRILFPDGSSLDLDSIPASDASGYSGLSDKVDSHEWRLMKGVALATILGIGAEWGAGGSNGDLASAIRDSAQNNGARAADQIVARELDVRPTLTIRPGWPVRAILNRDLQLRPWE
jgi:type IV secretion system protein VirB10